MKIRPNGDDDGDVANSSSQILVPREVSLFSIFKLLFCPCCFFLITSFFFFFFLIITRLLVLNSCNKIFRNL
ncbi:hypothetical protein HanRHA438_Chr15g0709231 [Helianthus annuus]|nr:hypothetical protein HanRHA438_Chr15g0709231 [Helianthus annuus]